MTKPPLISSDVFIRRLKRAGFEPAPHQGKGSHYALHKRTADGERLLAMKIPSEFFIKTSVKLTLHTGLLSFPNAILCRGEYFFRS